MAATAAIARNVGHVLITAPLFISEPIGAADQTFLNSAIMIASDLSPDVVLTKLLTIEQELGRIRQERWGNRSIDLDLLLWQRRDPGQQDHLSWSSACWNSPQLQIPHPEMLKRDFVMIPAVFIAPEWLHPHSARTLAAELTASGFTALPQLQQKRGL